MNVLALALILLASEAQLASPRSSEDATEATMRRDLVTAERKLLVSRQAQGHVQENLRRLAEKRALVRDELLTIAERHATVTQRSAELVEEKSRLETELPKLRMQAAARLSLLSRQARAGPLELLLSAAGPADFVYRYHALRAVAAADRQLLVELQEKQTRLEATRLDLFAQSAVLRDLSEKTDAEAQRLTALETLRLEQAEILRREVSEREAWVKSMREATEALGIMVGRIPESAVETTARNFLEPVRGERVASFGAPDPLAGNLLRSRGWRYRTPSGEDVKAAAPGIVTYADWFQGYGNLVLLDHGGGTLTLYAHLDNVVAVVGDRVAAGQVIGSAGSSGSLLEPGLYFEVRSQGQPIDPAIWFARAASGL